MGQAHVRPSWDDSHSPPPSGLAQDARDYPALYPFGLDVTHFLDPDEETTAPFEARLKSTWRYIVKRVKIFAATLRPREAAILDCEDIVNAIVLQLIEKDHFWDPERGKYSTFVENIIRNVLSTCHEQARAVTGPSNSHGRLQGYQERQRSGTMTRGMERTMTAIRHVMGDFDSLAEEADKDPADFDVQGLLRSLRRIDDPISVWALVHKYGLLGTEPLTYKQIARHLRIREAKAREMVKAARATLKQSYNGRERGP